MDAVVQLRSEEPSLAGFRDYDAIAAQAFGGRDCEDTQLLVGRLYNDMVTAAQGGAYGGSVSKSDVRAQLMKPQPVAGYSREYFDQLIEDTRARTVAEPAYATQISQSRALAYYPWNRGWDNYNCVVDGIPMLGITCRTLVAHGLYERLDILDCRVCQ